MRHVHCISPAALPPWEAARRRATAVGQIRSPANALKNQKHRMEAPMIAWTELTRIPSKKQETAQASSRLTFHYSKTALIRMNNLVWNVAGRRAANVQQC